MKPVGSGNRLVCVRCRYDSERQRRIKTVERIEEERPWFASGAVYLVNIGWDEAALRASAADAVVIDRMKSSRDIPPQAP